MQFLKKHISKYVVFAFLIKFINSAPLSHNAELKLINITNHHDPIYVENIMRLSKSAEMRNYMNESVDPCNDFYAFSCGNWAKINPANTIEHITTGLFEGMTKAFNRKVTKLLKDDIDPVDTEIDEKVKRFYKSCNRIGEQRGEYQSKLKAIIGEFGEMPALSGENWNEEDFDWLETIAKIAHKYGITIIIGLEVFADFVDNTVNRLYMGQQDFLLETRSIYLDDFASVYRESYKEKIAASLKSFLGLKKFQANVIAGEILDFEVSLASGMIDETLGLAVSDIAVLTSVDDMQRRYAPTVDVKRLINITMGEMITEPIYEYSEQYHVNLVEVIQNTPKKIIANYIYYALISNFMLESAKTATKQQKSCIDETKKYFAKNLDNMIYRKYNTKEAERDIDLMWKELKTTFKVTLQSHKLNWINRETRQYAIEKLDAMKLDINSYSQDNFTLEFGDLIISDDNYIDNIRNILELSSKQSRLELHRPPKPIEAGELLSYTPANILLENAIKVPVSLLQPNFLWSASYPNALKFGTLASLIAHELIHGFDDSGRKFDKNGNNYDWWDEASAASFLTRTQCFSNQYSTYVYNGRHLPKSVSQSENIADNGGVRLAYAAYLNWYADAVSTASDLRLESLPNINYTSKQLFFISYAQFWCNDAHPRYRDLQTYTDEHVPGKYRVIVPLSNFEEFAREFNCALGTKMNPLKKCHIY